MSKWKCEICKKEFDNFHAQGFDNKIYCPLCFFKEKTNRLKKENARLKEFKKEHEIMKKILIEKSLWETLLNDDRFLEYLREEN